MPRLLRTLRRAAEFRARALAVLASLACLLIVGVQIPTRATVQTQTQSATRTPTETVREFYTKLRERRFQEAFAISVYRPAVESLNAEELAELRPEFEALATSVPTQIEITGEQTSGEVSTVFMKLAGAKVEIQPVGLMRVKGVWIVGDMETNDAVRKAGKKFFIEARIATHHDEVTAIMTRIAQAQLAYSLQHAGVYADIPTLIKAGLLPRDIESTDMVGYRFRVTPSADRKTFTAGAEPVRYNRTGRLSFFMNKGEMIGKDTGGKPLTNLKK